MRKYTDEEIEKMADKAQDAVVKTTITATGLGFVPIGFDIAVFAGTVAVGVVAVGKSFDFSISKGDAGDLIKQFMGAAGMTYMFLTTGGKLLASLLKSNPLSYLPVAIADAALCGATAYAICSTSKEYFRRKAHGKQATREEIKRWMEEGRIKGKAIARKAAEEKAKEIKAQHTSLPEPKKEEDE